MVYDFITDTDWFNRSGPFVFNLEHILFIFFYIILGICLSLWLRKKPVEFSKKVIKYFWLFVCVIDVIKWSASWYVWHVNGSIHNLEIVFPLYTCSMILYITPVALFSKKEKLKTAAKNFICTMLLPLGFVSIFLSLMMTTNCSIFSFYGFHTVLFHSLMYIIGLCMLTSGYYKPEKKDIYKGLALFACILFVVQMFNYILDVDYMYMNDGSTFTVLSFLINALPHKLIWTLMILIFYFTIPTLMHFIILKIQSVIDKKKINTTN